MMQQMFVMFSCLICLNMRWMNAELLPIILDWERCSWDHQNDSAHMFIMFIVICYGWKTAEVRWNKITLEQTAFCANVARVYVLWNWWFSVYGLCGVCAHHAAVAMRSQKGLFIFLFPLVCESVLCHAIPLVLTDSAATATDCTDYIYIYSVSDRFNRYNPS